MYLYDLLFLHGICLPEALCSPGYTIDSALNSAKDSLAVIMLEFLNTDLCVGLVGTRT